MDSELHSQLDGLRKGLEQIEQHLVSLMGKTTREWITTYYDAIERIPDSFIPEQWKDTEKIIYDSLVEEVNGEFTARGVFQSGMRIKLLEILKKERDKLLETRKNKP